MKLSDLIGNAEAQRVHGDPEVAVSGLAYDSRQIKPGNIFFSTARDQEQARAHIQDALRRGARAVVVQGWADDDARPALTMVESASPRRLMGLVASRFFNEPSK
ncbi:MAG: UDP-N-acetylmuramoyl-L-alanyl-D-glutamate--2,6-diaminopimelate ligase, partial [Deltaproteobacteria bacterium]|nr:UDP-N-acetylmuramoyl-L-alanyl-D-glutamate--2,6-diaminopimelate ligase [Deltaproteobacteria bacterium]